MITHIMHESGIAYDIYATSKRAAENNNAIRVKTIYVDVGSMAMVNPDQILLLMINCLITSN